MERNLRIRDFFDFLKENRWDEETVDLVIGRLGIEIQQERLLATEGGKNDYLESLLEIKNGQLEDYFFFVNHSQRKEAISAFRKLMDLLIQDVRLYGLDLL